VRDGILEGLTLPLESTVSGHFGHQRTIANLAERLIHAVMPHIVSMKKPKNVGRNGRRGNVNIMDSGGVDLTVIRGTIKGQPPFYIGVRSVEMGPDIPRRRFAAVVLDAEWNEGGASVVFEARRCWRYGSCSWASSISRSRRLWRVSGASSIWYLPGSTTSALTPSVTSTASYTQPFGNNELVESKSLGEDTRDFFAVVVCRWNCAGILVVFKGADEVSCQCCGLRTIEVNPRHAVGRNGS
jgi:ribosomal protein S27E